MLNLKNRIKKRLKRMKNKLGFFEVRKGPFVDVVNYSPNLKFYSTRDIINVLNKYRKKHKKKIKFLDVGGRYAECKKYAKGFDYAILEIGKSLRGKNVIKGDICNCPQIMNNTFDVVFSNNVFEHLKEPWNAATESVRMLKKGGLIICITPFSWRYHPVPVDTFRYSHYGLTYLFERTGKIKTMFSGYDIKDRRVDLRGGYNEKGLDVCPRDVLGGWRENWETIYVGYKK